MLARTGSVCTSAANYQTSFLFVVISKKAWLTHNQFRVEGRAEKGDEVIAVEGRKEK
jgi:hypothetical protein